MIKWVTKFLDQNEKELCEMLAYMKDQEESRLKEWEKLKRFEKIAKRKKENPEKEIKSAYDL